jgi:hypothetical protein
MNTQELDQTTDKAHEKRGLTDDEQDEADEFDPADW